MRSFVTESQASSSTAVFASEARPESACSDDACAGVRAVCNAASSGESLQVRAERVGGNFEARAEHDDLPKAEDSGPRTIQSVRAEQAALRPRGLAKAKSDFARRFDEVMHAHWVRGEEAYSNVAVARACNVSEKAVREWRRGIKRIPPECIAKLPGQLFDQTIEIMTGMRSRAPKRAIAQLRQALADLPSQLAGEDPAEVLRALLNAQGELAALMAKAVGGR